MVDSRHESAIGRLLITSCTRCNRDWQRWSNHLFILVEVTPCVIYCTTETTLLRINKFLEGRPRIVQAVSITLLHALTKVPKACAIKSMEREGFRFRWDPLFAHGQIRYSDWYGATFSLEIRCPCNRLLFLSWAYGERGNRFACGGGRWPSGC